MKCNCPCHSGAGVMHYDIVNQKSEVLTNSQEYIYGANSSCSTKMVACPCDLNIKIQQLTKDYYEKKEKK